MATMKHTSNGVSAWRLWAGIPLATLSLISVSMLWPSQANATPAVPTAVTEDCQPTDGNPTGECEPRTDDGAVEWDAYDETPPCVARTAIAAAVGAGTGGLGGAAWGTAGGIGYCWVDSWE